MKHLSSTSLLLSAVVLLCGCGGGVRASAPPSSPPSGPPVGPPTQGQNISGNWQISTTSTALPGIPPATIVGSITQSDSSVSGVVHVDGWTCLDPQIAVGVTGTLTDGDVSLTSTSVDGQVITFVGSISKKTGFPYALTGTYAVNGGCADGDQGNVTGIEVSLISGNWAGDLTSQTGDVNRMVVTLTQGSATPEGRYPMTGIAGFEVGTCFKEATILSGIFPSGSYIMGRAVTLEVGTDNGIITLVGTTDHGGLMEGTYTIAGGTCELTGTWYLSPWEY